MMDNFGFYLVMTDPAAGYVKCCEAAVKAGGIQKNTYEGKKGLYEIWQIGEKQ